MNFSSILAATWPENAALVLAALALAAGAGRWARGRSGMRWGRLIAALVLLVLALSSPMNALAEGCLFSAHMAQHLLLLVIIPALAVLSLPPSAGEGGPNARTDPKRFERSAAGAAEADDQRTGTRARSWGPAVGWAAGIGAMYFWHIPALCDAASASTAIHGVQSISLLALGGLFWWPIFAPDPASRLGPWTGIGYLFTACLACTALGILLTLTPVEVCPSFRAPVDRFGLLPTIRGPWGISAARDRALGGLLMWVPMCAIYVSAILLELGRWYGAAGLGRREARS